MKITILPQGTMAIYEQIVNQLKNEIVTGELTPGEALPSIRMLAADLSVSVITTKRAYEELERDGFIETVTGKGSFVAGRNLQIIKEEQQRITEEYMEKAVVAAKAGGISLSELVDILKLFYGED